MVFRKHFLDTVRTGSVTSIVDQMYIRVSANQGIVKLKQDRQ